MGVPLEDIRTATDSIAIADQIAALVRHLTRDPTIRLYCSLAGGRKTQSALLGFALQLYGRPQDQLLHVLVDEALQHHPAFFRPSKESRLLPTCDGRLVEAHTAHIDVADIPFLRLREKLFTSTEFPGRQRSPATCAGCGTAIPASLARLLLPWRQLPTPIGISPRQHP